MRKINKIQFKMKTSALKGLENLQEMRLKISEGNKRI